MTSAMILTGTCGSGKTTISAILAKDSGWRRIAEDEIWKRLFGTARGQFGTEEHRLKRLRVHEQVFPEILVAHRRDQNVVIDATVHESPPESYQEYSAFFETHGIPWRLRVLHPRLEVAIERDSRRPDWVAGPERIKRLRAKFTGLVFAEECFFDNSDETQQATAIRILGNSADARAIGL